MSKRLPIVTVDNIPATVTLPAHPGNMACGICGDTTQVLGVKDHTGWYQEICISCIGDDPRVKIEEN